MHVLVNCAGGDIGAKGVKPSPNNALDIDYEDIKVLTENNLIGTMLVCQAFVPPMVKRGSGSVINIASAAAHIGCSPEVVYSTLKAAVVHYTRCLAKELIDDGVRINAVSPGATKTARFQASRVVDPDAHGFEQEIAEPVCGAGRDRRSGGLPCRSARALHQRAGHPGRWRLHYLPRLNRGRSRRLPEVTASPSSAAQSRAKGAQNPRGAVVIEANTSACERCLQCPVMGAELTSAVIELMSAFWRILLKKSDAPQSKRRR